MTALDLARAPEDVILRDGTTLRLPTESELVAARAALAVLG